MKTDKISLVSDTIDRADVDALIKWLQEDPIPRLTKGDLTKELEAKWAEKIGTKYSVFVNSGSSSILLTLAAMKELGQIPSGKVVVPGLSWATDVSSPMLLGLDPIFCDCNLEDLSCDLDHLEQIFKTENPDALILVSPLGFVPDMDRLLGLCQRHNVLLLEDVCESMGSKYKEQYLGSMGYASFFSTYFGHHISTIEGGFINTNDEDLYHMLLMMRSHGWDRDLPKEKQQELREKYNISEFDSLYNFYVPGMNLRSTDLQAFLGLRAIDKLDDFAFRRYLNYNQYTNLIEQNGLSLIDREGCFNSNFAYPLVKKNKKVIVEKLKENNIEVRPLIAGNMANKTMFSKKIVPILDNCNLIDEYGFYVPNHQDLKTEELNRIIDIINTHG